MRHLLSTSLFVFGLLAPSVAAAQVEHVRVIWHGDTSHEAVVSWSTPEATEGAVQWSAAKSASTATYATRSDVSYSGVYSESDGTHYHHTTLDNLPADSSIYFRITAGEVETEPLWFQTAPNDASPFILLYGGDSRSDSDARRAMNRRIRDLAVAQPSVIALAHGGDYIYSADSWTQWERWLDDWSETITDDRRVLPIIPARGNHEGDGELYNEVFGFPGDPQTDGDWFATRIGNDFILLNLDSNVSQAGVQRAWLSEQLADAQRYRWIAANYHRPAYPAVKSPGGALYHWVPLFEQFNVDFVLESDGHVLKRTVPIRAGKQDPTGVVYLGEGGLGVPQRTPDRSRWYLQPPGMAASAHHVQALYVSPEGVRYTAVGMEGEVLDSYDFEPRRKGSGPAANEVEVLPLGEQAAPTTELTAWWTRFSRRDVIELVLGLLVVVAFLGGLTYLRRRSSREDSK